MSCLGPHVCTRSIAVQTPSWAFRGTFGTILPNLETAYIMFVLQSTLEYAASIWDPHLAKNCDLLEKLQQRSVRYVKGNYRTTSSVPQILHDLKDRRRVLRLALLYKIVTGHVTINPDQICLVAAEHRTRANHRYKFKAIGASSTGLHYSFAVRTVSDWNQLPAIVVKQETPAAFKAQLARSAPVACHNPLPA